MRLIRGQKTAISEQRHERMSVARRARFHRTPPIRWSDATLVTGP